MVSRKGVLLGGSWGLIGEENIRPVLIVPF